MPILTEKDWKAWHEERERFKKRDTSGFLADIEALAQHILKLQEVCPRDAAGWPAGTALAALDKLKKDLDRFKRYLDQLR